MKPGRFLALGLAACLAGGFGPAAAQSPAPMSQDRSPISGEAVVTIIQDGSVSVNEVQVADGDLGPALQGALAREGRVLVRGDSRVAFSRVRQVMEMVRQAGFTKIALVSVRGGR